MPYKKEKTLAGKKHYIVRTSQEHLLSYFEAREMLLSAGSVSAYTLQGSQARSARC
jgi:hypothetical protein